jgi:hypothetical protein
MAKAIRRREVIGLINRAGCTFEREGAKHTLYRCPCGQHRVVVPRHSEISAGVVASIDATPCMEGVLQ